MLGSKVLDKPIVGLITGFRTETLKSSSFDSIVFWLVKNYLSKLRAVFNRLVGCKLLKPVTSKLCDSMCFSFRFTRNCSTSAPTPTILVDLAGSKVFNL